MKSKQSGLTCVRQVLLGMMALVCAANVVWAQQTVDTGGQSIISPLSPGIAIVFRTENTQVRTSSFEYDGNGMLVKEMVEPDRPDDCLTTTYSYDLRGNKTGSVQTTCAGAGADATASATAARTSGVSYVAHTVSIAGVNYQIPDNQFATTVVNALNQSESRQFDPRFGGVLSSTGPNGLTTRWEYDGFGRKTKETRADGTYTTWKYEYCARLGGTVSCEGLDNEVAYLFTQSDWAVDGTPLSDDKLTYVDAFGRVLAVKSLDFGGSTVVLQSTVYNELGQIVRTTEPYRQGSEANSTTTTYDKLGRVLSVRRTDTSGGTSQTSHAYSGLSVTSTDLLGTQRITKNLLGKTASTEDAQGNRVTFRYDAMGQLISSNAAGQVLTLSYDKRGRKVGMNDPSMGVWRYAYNAFGEMIRQTDSLGQVSTMRYDVLGRMTQRTEPDLTSDWYFDVGSTGQRCGTSVGKLCEARTDNGYKRTHNYDALGRNAASAYVLDRSDKRFIFSATYDANTARVKTRGWEGVTAAYNYNPKGYLTSVTGMGINIAEIKYDWQGRMASYVQGGFTTNRTFDPIGKLSRIQTQVTGDTPGAVFDQSYVNDVLGRTTQRTDAYSGVQESYTYDNLNRLTGYTTVGREISPPNTIKVAYDVRGNITFKSDVGSYWYDPDRPNRLVQVSLDGNAQNRMNTPSTGTRVLWYAFDDFVPGATNNGAVSMGNGNLMYTVSHDPSSGRHVARWESYTSFNMPKEIKYTNLDASNYQLMYAKVAPTWQSGPSGAIKVCPTGYSLTANQEYCISNNTVSQQISSTDAPLASSDRTLSYVYGPEHQRIKQVVSLSNNAPTNLMGGTTWFVHGDNNDLSFEYEQKANGVTELRYFLSVADISVGSIIYRIGTGINGSDPNPNNWPVQKKYFVQDNLGSVAVVLDDNDPFVQTSSPMYQVVRATSSSSFYASREGNQAQLRVVGGAGVDKVLVRAYSNVDARSLGGGNNIVYLQGRFADYQPTQGSNHLTLTRGPVTRQELVMVAGGDGYTGSASQNYDMIVFGDGWLRSADLYRALQQGTWAQLRPQSSVTSQGADVGAQNATLTERYAYDPWGKRRHVNGLADNADSIVGGSTDRGYTLHQHLDEIGVIHMNGRVYDPLIGRFMSADPYIQSPGNLQSYNRYAYVMNNPMFFTDPSGYWSLSRWWNRNITRNTFARTIVSIVVAYYTGQWISENVTLALAATSSNAAVIGALAGGAAGGAAGAFTNASLNGASFGDSLKAGINGGFTGALFAYASTFGAPTDYSRYAAHGVAGCLSSVANGANCGQGAAAAVFGKFATNNIAISDMIGKGVATAIAGGVGSVIGGGKFANGATTAAFGYIFNELSHATFNRESGLLYVRDADTGKEAHGQFFSGTGSSDQIPPGDYAILQRGDKDGFRLEPFDSVFGNDKHDDTGQSLLRLHGPGRSNGCVTACDASGWSQVKALITNTATTQVEVTRYKSITSPYGGYLLGRVPIGTEKVNYYGRLKVK